MSIYVTTVGELAKRHQQNCTEFMERLRKEANLSFELKIHLQKLTQPQVDEIMNFFYPTQNAISDSVNTNVTAKLDLSNPNVAIFKRVDGMYLIHLLEGKMNEKNLIEYEIKQTYARETKLGALVLSDNLKYVYDIDNGAV